jgi:hypothetical protein
MSTRYALSRPTAMDVISLIRLPILLLPAATRPYRLGPLGRPFQSPTFADITRNGGS